MVRRKNGSLLQTLAKPIPLNSNKNTAYIAGRIIPFLVQCFTYHGIKTHTMPYHRPIPDSRISNLIIMILCAEL